MLRGDIFAAFDPTVKVTRSVRTKEVAYRLYYINAVLYLIIQSMRGAGTLAVNLVVLRVERQNSVSGK